MFVLGPSCIFSYLVKIIVFINSQRDVFWGYIFNTNKLCLYTMGNVCSYKRYQRSLQSYLSVERANTASVFELMGLSMMGSVGEDIQRKFSPPPLLKLWCRPWILEVFFSLYYYQSSSGIFFYIQFGIALSFCLSILNLFWTNILFTCMLMSNHRVSVIRYNTRMFFRLMH